jgi:hypothetical protein
MTRIYYYLYLGSNVYEVVYTTKPINFESSSYIVDFLKISRDTNWTSPVYNIFTERTDRMKIPNSEWVDVVSASRNYKLGKLGII